MNAVCIPNQCAPRKPRLRLPLTDSGAWAAVYLHPAAPQGVCEHTRAVHVARKPSEPAPPHGVHLVVWLAPAGLVARPKAEPSGFFPNAFCSEGSMVLEPSKDWVFALVGDMTVAF
jgi:hypothetical protein